MADGTVLELWRHPVKSMAGERLRSLKVDWRGVGGDRTHAILDGDGPVTAREAPQLLAWSAEYSFAPDATLDPSKPPTPNVTAPGGARFAWADQRLRRRLEEDLGRPVTLHRDPNGQHDLEESVLVTVEASRAALEAELGAPVDIRRFRPNLHLQLDAAPWEELGWEGRRVVLAGGVALRLLHPCTRCAIPTRDPDTQEKWPELVKALDAGHDRCFGINARVEVPGRIGVGETLQAGI